MSRSVPNITATTEPTTITAISASVRSSSELVDAGTTLTTVIPGKPVNTPELIAA